MHRKHKRGRSMKMILFFLVLGLSFLAAVLLSRKRDAIGHEIYDWLENENMPSEIRDAVIYMNETEIRNAQGFKRRVDQVYLTRLGSLVVVDTKTRNMHRVYQDDIDQVRDYALILASSEPYPVSTKCYIRTVIIRGSQKSVCYHAVSPRFELI